MSNDGKVIMLMGMKNQQQWNTGSHLSSAILLESAECFGGFK
jgi:hypothetical protein